MDQFVSNELFIFACAIVIGIVSYIYFSRPTVNNVNVLHSNYELQSNYVPEYSGRRQVCSTDDGVRYHTESFTARKISSTDEKRLSESYLTKPKFYEKINSVVSDFRKCVKAVATIMNRKPFPYTVVGLDCEMARTSGRHPIPVLLQLANPDGYCAIFQLKTMKKSRDKKIENSFFSHFEPSHEDVLLQVLQDPFLLKVGVAVTADVKYLEENYSLFCKGDLDIRYVAREVGVEPRGLADLAKDVLGRKRVKRKVKDPWENDELSPKQIEYAAEDARLSVDIFMELNKRAVEKRYSWIRRSFWDEKTYWQYSMKLWEKYIGEEFGFDEKTKKKEVLCDGWSNVPTVNRSLRYKIPESSRFCAVCDEVEFEDFTFMRKSVVPVDYNIPCDFQDYFYLCKTCTKESLEDDYKFREELREKCGAPYPEYKSYELLEAQEFCEDIISCRENGEYLLYCERKLCSLFNLPKSKLCLDTLATIKAMDCLPGSAHGLFVHDYFKRFYDDGVDLLKWIWILRFMTTMKPRNLPRSWRRYYFTNETRFCNSHYFDE